MKKKIKWNNIIFLVLNIIAIIMYCLALKNIDMLNKTDLTKYRLTLLAIVCYLSVAGGSLIIKKYKRGE